MEIRIFASEEGFDELYRIANNIAMLTNPQLFWDTKDMDDLICRALLAESKDQMKEMME
jgi:hypothetical protein